MVSSGMTILRALYVLEAQTENEKLAGELVDVRKDVEAGLPLSDALERHPKTFNPLFVAMTRAGETGGVLEESLLRDRRPAREGGVAAPPGQVGDGLPDRDLHLRAVGHARAWSRSSCRSSRASSRSSAAPSCPSMTQFTMGISNVVTGYWYLLLVRHRRRSSSASSKWKKTPRGREHVAALPAAHPVQDRRHLPEGRPGPLVAHVLGAHGRRRAAAAGDRHHEADGGQRRRRGGDGRTSRRASRPAARSPSRSWSRPCSRRWSATWSRSARRPAP